MNKIKIDFRETGCEDEEEISIIHSVACFALTNV